MNDPGQSDPHGPALRRYVAWRAGLLDEEQAREAITHVETCDACRESAEAMVESARATEGGPGHLAPDLLARWPRDSARLHGLERELVRHHVERCALCREDLALLGHAPELAAEEAVPNRAAAEPAPRRTLRLEPRRISTREWLLGSWGALATAACLLIAALHGVIGGSPPPVPVVSRPQPPAETPPLAPGGGGMRGDGQAGNGVWWQGGAGATAPEAVAAVRIDLGRAGERGGPGSESPTDFPTASGPAGLQIVHPGGLAIGVPAGARVRVTVTSPSGEKLTFERKAADLERQSDFVLLPKRHVEPGEYKVRYEFVDRSLQANDAEVSFRITPAKK